MTTANEADRVPPPTGDAPSANGSGALRDRVRSLRLAHDRGAAAGASLPMKVIPWGLCVILLGVTAAFGYYAYAIAPTRASLNAGAAGPAAPAPTDGSTAAASSGAGVASSGEVALEAKGYVTPVHQIQVSPKVSGMLDKVDPNLEEGHIFHETDVLAHIEELPYLKDCAHAEKAYAGAQKRHEQAVASLASGRATLQGKQDAFMRNQSAQSSVSAGDVVQSKADFTAQEATVKALEAAVEAAQADEESAHADLEKAKWNLDNCTIRAPVTGTILTKSAERGNIVNPSAFSNGISASLCNMADLADLEVELKVQERDIPKVRKGQYCLAMPEAYAADPEFLKIHPKGYEGRVSRLMPTADRSQGAIPVRVKLDIPKGEEGVYLKPDMGVVVQFRNAAPGQ